MRYVLLLLSLLFIFPSAILGEEISSFSSDIIVQQNGTIDVKETIDYDFESASRHGIFRTIPYIKTNTEGKKFRMNLEPQRVVDEAGAPYTYTTTDESGALTVKIGDANKTITGKHTYVIPYTVSGALTYFSDHDELYWNVTGNAWDASMQHVTASVQIPKPLESSEVRLTCYTGYAGSTAQECTSSYDNGVATFTASLASREGLTIVAGFPKNLVAVLEPTRIVPFWETLWGKLVIAGIVIASLLWYLVLPLKIVVDWFKRGRDPKAPIGVASAWFSVPKTPDGIELTPAETGTLIDERADLQDVIAIIVDLARRGYVKLIEKKKGEFTIEQTKEFAGDASLLPFELTLLSGMFAGSTTFTTKQASLIGTVSLVKKALYERVVELKLFDKNPQAIRDLYSIIGILGLVTGNIPLMLAAFIFGHGMPKKTLVGSQTANIAKSLKNFITSQERQFKYQASRQILFEKFLPFAIAFGVEQIWAERFKNIALKQPDWYEGEVGRRFSSTLFVHSLSSSFTSSVAHAITPTSSSSGFSSGSSGGSSGGGGGGGGGGSW